jgi:hypothetical protein
MAKKKTREDLAFPVATVPKMGAPTKTQDNPAVIKMIIQGAIKGAYQLKTPSEPSSFSSEYGKKQKALVSEEQIQFVTHLIESLEPTNAIEAVLASQFAIAYIRGLDKAQGHYQADLNSTLQLFEFGHSVLETLTKYRTKGAQLINVQYNHNQGQINNINVSKNDDPQLTIEVC